MNGESSQLPWNELQRTDATIPWPALRAFADALVDGSSTRAASCSRSTTGRTKRSLTTPATRISMWRRSSPWRRPARRRATARDRIVPRSKDWCGPARMMRMSPWRSCWPPPARWDRSILPAVLDAIASEPDTRGAWLFLWDLTKLAAQSEDEALREPGDPDLRRSARESRA